MNGARALARMSAAIPGRQLSTEISSHGLMGPAVRLLLHQYGLAEKDVVATGPKKNVLKSDVMTVVESRNLKPVGRSSGKVVEVESKKDSCPKGSERLIGGYIDIPLSNMRKTIAKRLSQSKQNIPHEYVSTSIKWDAISSLRSKLKKDGIVVSVNDFIIKAVANALRAVPSVNVRWSKESIISLSSIDISVAVATPSGLITPIVFNADSKGVLHISQTVRDLAKKAKENKLQPNEFQGGSFTISNLGMFGSVTGFTAIINEPQAAILTVGGPSIQYDEYDHSLSTCTFTLCYDGRAISQESARSFISYLSQSLEDPLLLMTTPPLSSYIPSEDDLFDYSKLL